MLHGMEDLEAPCEADGKESACYTGDSLRSLGWKDPLEKGTATHTSIRDWKILWTGISKNQTRLSD